MNQELMNKAAKILWDAWSTGHTISGLPKDCRPTTRQSAYEIQKRIADLSQSAQIGWKIAATSENGQKHIGASGPLAGQNIAFDWVLIYHPEILPTR
jgi:2-keto-4-pentenoate hydratase